ncbi:hypothetical protein REJC140_02210 [Pseudorhizobium endolithicum]|uniref:Uncharacterized protein n=1 Tax=Pseudorhizobium endolithicum TaxID=1191678 RepID=A0ABN7K3L8_9HYPH|nr:hypothetical protein [Pseudorhizobium endolithicum]CAD6424878.1 hypothetical protein REQ54_02676 [Rhizobium sp. Q54]CAD7054701.1 hypothetical protein REJC140_02210 [Pseudorhizobium endolithicum]
MYEVVAALVASSRTDPEREQSSHGAEDRYYENLGAPLPRSLVAARRLLLRLWHSRTSSKDIDGGHSAAVKDPAPAALGLLERMP